MNRKNLIKIKMKPEKINVAFVTTLFSPFQIELFNKINTDNRYPIN